MKYGEIYEVNFNPVTGQEIAKTRPALIVNSDAVGKLALKVVVPVTDAINKNNDWHVPLIPSKLNGLKKPSVADCFQIKSLAKKRFRKKIGRLSESEMEDVKIALMKVLELI